MVLRADINITGVERTQKILQHLLNMPSWKPVLQETGEFLVNFYSTLPFETSGLVYGEPWEALNEQYRLEKAREYPGRGILRRTGEMQSGFVFDAREFSVTIDNTAEYFVKHQTGKGVPKRESMKVDSSIVDTVGEFFGNVVNEDIVRLMRQ